MLVVFDDRGIPTVEIEDAKGEVLSYQVRLAPRGLSRYAVDLRNLANGEEYRVSLEHAGWWRCSCPAFFYRKSKDHVRGCKHATALRHLYGLLQALT